jgi:hypothetical protein
MRCSPLDQELPPDDEIGITKDRYFFLERWGEQNKNALVMREPKETSFGSFGGICSTTSIGEYFKNMAVLIPSFSKSNVE